MIFIIFLYGIVIGSFLNVCIYRIPEEKSIITPASACGSCNKTLAWRDLVPVLSYLLLGGKCRYCKSKVSIRYVLIELTTGFLLVGLYLKYGLTYSFFKFAMMTFILIVIALIDFDTTDVYSITTIPFIIMGIILILIENINTGIGIGQYIKNSILGASGGIIGALVIWAICYFTGGMGEGDIEIAVLIGLFIGGKLTIFMILISFIVGGVFAGILILSGVKTRKDVIAFGPSLAIAAYITVILGIEFITMYFIP